MAKSKGKKPTKGGAGNTKAIVETLVGHKTDKQTDFWQLLGDPRHSYADQVLKAYEYQDGWVNRLILGDSLVVMNSLLRYERLGGQVQTIYIDPPYGVKFGSDFQPFVRKRDVSHGDDEDLNVFGAENFAGQVVVQKTGGLGASGLTSVADYLLWYARDKERLKYHALFAKKLLGIGECTGARYDQLLSSDGVSVRSMTTEERDDPTLVPQGWRAFQLDNLTSGAFRENTTVPYQFEGETFHPGSNACWKTTVEGLDRLTAVGRVQKAGRTLRYRRFLDDFQASEITNVWDDVAGATDRLYVVQTSASVVGRCVLMTTDPGDLVLDPTCGSGTTAYVAEQWGRRWITIDTSRAPLALARQRLLTATFPYYELKEPAHGPSGGFVYKRNQNNRGEEVGGIVPHVTLKSIANSQPPDEVVLVDRPETDRKFVRVTGPFVVEATIPTPVDWEGDSVEDSGAESVQSYGSFTERMIEVLRRSPVLHVGGGKKVELGNIRPPAKSLSLSAEAVAFNDVRLKPDATTGETRPVAFVFGPENGAISEKLVHSALQEAQLKSYTHLYVIGFAIQPHARELIDKSADMGLVPATYVQATPDLMMGDLLKNMRSSQIFSVCGLPEIRIHRTSQSPAHQTTKSPNPSAYEVELVGLDTFDPTTMAADHRRGEDVPCWMLDSDYNGLCFRASQVFFPRTAAWDSLRKALKADYDESVWDHLAGARSAPFEAGEQKQIAVKVIDDRGNELLVVKALA